MSSLWPDPVPGAPYTSRSLAQLVLAAAARETADYARSLVPTGQRRTAYDGSLLAGAVRLQELGRQVLEAAILVEREDGTDWHEIDERIGADVDAPAAERRWRDRLDRAQTPSRADDDLPEVMLEDPTALARRLDEWVVRHREPLDPIDGAHPVTDTLEAMHPMLELMHLRGQQERVRQQHSPHSAQLLVPLLEREAVVHDALAAAGGADAAEHTQQAARVRARAAELRGEGGSGRPDER